MSSPRLTMLGMVLAEFRLQRGWTMEQLAEKSGVDKSTISRLEAGVTSTAHEANLQKLAGALGVDLDELRELGRQPAVPVARMVVEEVTGLLPAAVVELQGTEALPRLARNIALLARAVTELSDEYSRRQAVQALLESIQELVVAVEMAPSQASMEATGDMNGPNVQEPFGEAVDEAPEWHKWIAGAVNWRACESS